jgi:F0F1-type ATP synthase membrane subunit a
MDTIPILLIQLLLPIEKISYAFRVISLPVRPFANMTAGHSLTKVISSFIPMIKSNVPALVACIVGGIIIIMVAIITTLEIFICFL